MIHIKYKIKISKTHGVGLFADQKIKKGDLIYTPNPLLDVNLSHEEFNSLEKAEQDEVKYYGYFHHKTAKWHVAFEAIRFLNHSEESNVSQDENMIMVALQDIEKGDELLQDYAEIYPTQDNEHYDRINNN